MARQTLIAFLQSTGFVSAPQASEIAVHFTPKTLAKHAFLLQQGRICDEYLVLETGLVRAFVHDPAGQEVTTGLYGAGQLAFEVASFFNRSPSQENLQALTASAGWVITYAQLNTLFHTRPDFREFGRSLLVQSLASLKGRMLAMITEPAAARYALLLRAQPELVQQVPLKYLASYLGITDTSLSRIRAGRRPATDRRGNADGTAASK